MTKTKITLLVSPTEKLVIYVDPEKNGLNNCSCQLINTENPAADSDEQAATTSNSKDDSDDKENFTKKAYQTVEAAAPQVVIDKIKDFATSSGKFNKLEADNDQNDDVEPLCNKQFVSKLFDQSEESVKFIAHYNKRFMTDDQTDMGHSTKKLITKVEEYKAKETKHKKNQQGENNNKAEKYPHKINTWEDDMEQKINSAVIDIQDLKDTTNLDDGQNKMIVHEQNQSLGSIQNESEKKDASNLAVDEVFIKKVANIMEASTIGARKQKFEELLRNLSAVQMPESAKLDGKTKTNGFWASLKKKNNGVVATSGPTRKNSLPFLNRSFYRYTYKSRAGLTFQPHKVYYYGEKGSGFSSQSGVQDFYEIRDQCLSNGTLFEDPEFPANDSSLFYSHQPDRRYTWKRPGEIVDNPQLFVEGFSRFDVQQGELGDCWLLAAVANLTLYRRLFFQIVPDDQSFDENYAGVFHFRFWQYGRWVDVVIDDRLPTYNGQLIFLHSTEENEFWSALLEKAYAKLHGSYEALKGGSTCEAMEDMTGGVTEMYELSSSPPNLFKIIVKAYERLSLMGVSIEPDPNVLEAQTPEGLVRGHAYSITKVQYVDISTPNVNGKIPLLRLRNPWGNSAEWNGPWSDNSPEWQFISEEQKEELGLNFDADGEFWISYKDFQKHFERLEICNLNPDSLTEDELTTDRNKKWVMSVYEGEWVRGVTAGGCRNFLNTFHHNPQYRITLEEVDEGDDEDKCTLIVGLMQKNRRQMRRTRGVDLLTIGFAIYHLPYPDRVPKPLDLNFFKFNTSVARSPSFINLREVSCRFKLPKGTYCIVPSTFDPNEEGEFLLRVFSEHQNNMVYDGSCTDNLPSTISTNRVDEEDEDNDRPSRGPYSDPYPSAPSNPYDTPSGPYPNHPPSPYSNPYPSNPYPNNPYPSNPYPNNPYPYPQTAYGQYPFPQNPQDYPQYPPPNPPPRNTRNSDPITNFFKGLFR